MNRRSFLGMFGAGAAAAVKCTDEKTKGSVIAEIPEPGNHGYGTVVLNREGWKDNVTLVSPEDTPIYKLK